MDGRGFEVDCGKGQRLTGLDFGGSGRPLLLLHGARCSAQDWVPIAPGLTSKHRVVAVDLRGHGGSSHLPWEWEAVLDDVATVVEERGLERPVVVGHSLGGMLALLWADRVPDCPGVLNFDGHSTLRPSLFAGWEPSEVASSLARLQQARDDFLIERVPSGSLSLPMYHALDALDLQDCYTRIKTPTHIVVTTRNGPEAGTLGLPWLSEFFDAFRAGLLADLATMGSDNPLLTFESVPRGHMIMEEDPDWVTASILRFGAECLVPSL